MEMLTKWILPLNGLNHGMPFSGHPIGNSPELMPLDCSLFADLNTCVQYHIMITQIFPENDIRKFNIYTMKRGAHAYLSILEPSEDLAVGSPPASRICEDVRKWVINLRTIYDAEGIMVKGLGDRNGKRQVDLEKVGGRGGKCIKGQGKSFLKQVRSIWLHDDTVSSKDLMISESLAKVQMKQDRDTR